uniref:WAP domain-containing protein n=1 Tax=Amphilophus citrinellus TaxID=61819 RepID=A0A3Q0SRR9_AMPCI
MDRHWSTVCALIVSFCALVCLSIMIYFFLSEKPGVCPFRPWNFIRCDELCSNDSDCPNNQKCCSTGCGQECMAPNIVKPGVCPRKPFDSRQCFPHCSNDGDCPDNQKCCFSGCGRTCIEPDIVKPGVCPGSSCILGLCAEFCSDDSDFEYPCHSG